MARLQLGNRPLLDTRADAELFVGRRSELSRLRRSLELRLNVLVHSEAGAGKTSLLRHLVWLERTNGGSTPHYLSATTASTVTELIELVAGALGVTKLPAEVSGDPLGLLAHLADVVKDEPGPDGPGAQPVVILDEPDADVAFTLFGQLRDEVWQLPVTWVVAMDSSDVYRLFRPPADAFFEVRLELPRLQPGEVRELLLRRVPAGLATERSHKLSDEVVAELAATRDPRRALDGARRLLTEEATWDDLKRIRKRRDDAVGELGPSARMVVDALSQLGGAASASDPELLELLGWTRPRAVQVLSGLEKAGILDTATVRHNGTAGRPRKVYRLVEAGAA